MEEIIERLARECAEPLIAVGQTRENHFVVYVVGTNDLGAGWATEGAYAAADRVRALLAGAVAAALRRFARTPPWPSPVSEERLAEIAEKLDQWCVPLTPDAPPRVREVAAVLADQQAQIAHLVRLVQAMSAESEGLIFGAGVDVGKRAGRIEGAAEQRAADVGSLRDEAAHRRAASGSQHAYACAGAVDRAATLLGGGPLVTDAKEGRHETA